MKLSRLILLPLLIGALILMQSCAHTRRAVTTSPTSKPRPTAAKKGTWGWARLDSDSSPLVVEPPYRYTLTFLDSTTARVVADCNEGTGPVQIEGYVMHLGPFGMTKVYCGSTSLDQRYLQALSEVEIFRLTADSLFLELGNNTGMMIFIRQ
jgi:heat shock protein HslJ